MKMSTTVLILLIVIGLITGAMSGLLGIGGAIIMIPALVYLLGFNQQLAQGTSLAVMLPPIGIIAAYNYYKAGEMNLKYALIVAGFFIVGSYFGSKLALQIPQQALRKIFAVLLLAVAAKMLFSK
ncbi:MAG TPA: sulfite exporter TauE/SafE family protein [Bacteroidales bacterium]|nr:sulfite exporter TauE/SafE family protein [Bacteroidales bacterium]